MATGKEIAAVAAVSSPVWAGLMIWVAQQSTIAADDLPSLCASGAHTSRIHDLLELASFASTAGLLLTAIVAGLFAFRQVKEARDARVAAIYMEINKNYNQDAMKEARETLKLVCRGHTLNPQQGETIDGYLCEKLLAWKELDPGGDDYKTFNRCARILQFWEDVGILVKHEFVDEDIVFDFFRSAILLAEKRFRLYIEHVRMADEAEYRIDAPSYVSSLYDNAGLLFRRAQAFTPT